MFFIVHNWQFLLPLNDRFGVFQYYLIEKIPNILMTLCMLCNLSFLGIAVCIGMASTFAFANSALKHQVSLRVIFHSMLL